MAFGKKIKQINNLTIRYTDVHQYSVWTPDGVCWEDRLTLQQAEDFCRKNTDFISRKVNQKNTAKKVITGTRQQLRISEVCLIDGYEVIYDGTYDGMFTNCNPSMILYRDKQLKRGVIAKYVFNHKKLFLFLEPETI